MSTPYERPKLLPEIVPEIILYLSNDGVSLFSCSTVSKVWLHATRTVMFHDVVLDDRPARTQDFIALLEHPLCTINTYIKNILLQATSPYTMPFLSEAIPAFPLLNGTVKQVTLRDIHWDTLSHPARAALCLNFVRVTSLRLENVHFDAFGDFANLINSFPLLRALDMVDSLGGPLNIAAAGADTPPCTLVHLDSLTMEACEMKSTLQWFMTPAVAESLRCVGLSGFLIPQCPTVSKFLQHVGSVIEELELGAESDPFLASAVSPPEISRLLDFSALSNVKHVSFHIEPGEPYAPIASLVGVPNTANEWNAFVPHALRTLAATSLVLTHAEFFLSAHKVAAIHDLDWAAIATVPLRAITVDVQIVSKASTEEVLAREVRKLKERLGGGVGVKDVVVESKLVRPVDLLPPELVSAVRNGMAHDTDIDGAANGMLAWMNSIVAGLQGTQGQGAPAAQGAHGAPAGQGQGQQT